MMWSPKGAASGPATCPGECQLGQGPQLSSTKGQGRHPPLGTHQGRAAGYTPAVALCPGLGMVPPWDLPHSSDGAWWCPHHREPSSCSRLTKAQGLGTHGVDTTGTH